MIVNERLISLGRQWIENHFELTHHGIKGQKWGVKNGPPYPIKRSGSSMIVKSSIRNVIDEALKSGEIKKEVNREKQLRHTKTNHLGGRSYLDGDLDFAQELINELSGTGEILIDKNGNWNHRELVTAGRTIGVYAQQNSNEERPSKNATIVYSKTGAHIYPRKG